MSNNINKKYFLPSIILAIYMNSCNLILAILAILPSDACLLVYFFLKLRWFEILIVSC